MTLLKKTVLTLAILASGALSVNAASPRIIDQPYYKENSSQLLNIDSIELSDTATILNASFYNSPGYWVSLNKGTYLKGRQTGRRYIAEPSYRGYILGDRCVMPENGTMRISLKFPPQEKNDTTIDLIEEGADGFRILGVHTGLSPVKSKIHCRISGTTDDPNCSRLILLPCYSSHHVWNKKIIPVRNGRFSHDLYCEHPEIYELADGAEFMNGSFRPIEFVAEDGPVEIRVTHNGENVQTDVSGGEMNATLSDFQKSRKGRSEIAMIDSLYEEMETLDRNNLLHSKEFSEVMEKQSQSGNSPEVRNDLFHKRDSLENIDMQYTPAGNMLKSKIDSIANRMRQLDIKFAREHVSVTGMGILMRYAYFYGNNIADIIDVYRESYSQWEPEHPYSVTMATIAASGTTGKGDRFIDFTAPDLNGRDMTLSELIRGKIALVDMWASWCGSCRTFSRQVIPIYEEYKDKGFTVVGIAREYKNTAALEKAISRDGYPWLNLVEIDDRNGIWTRYRIANAAGGTYLIDRNGIIVAVNPSISEVKEYLRNVCGK